MEQAGLKLFLVAGEASADVHAAALVRELKKIQGGLCVYGVGGRALQAEGMRLCLDSRKVNVVGMTDWLDKAVEVISGYRKIARLIEAERPDCAVLLDLPDFNLRLARRLKRLNVPVVYYISPQVWAWRRSRVEFIRKYVDRMLVVFPFEKEFYDRHGVDAVFVGHPMVDQVEARSKFRNAAEIRREPRIALLPGSRKSELKYHAPVMRALVAALRRRYPEVRFRVPVASTLSLSEVRRVLPDERIEVNEGGAADVVGWADLAVIASGTATLEAALIGTPFCLVYKVSGLSGLAFKHLIRYRSFLGMPNLLWGREIVREFFQRQASADQILCECEKLIEDQQYYATMAADLMGCRDLLGSSGASVRVAREIQQLIQSTRGGVSGGFLEVFPSPPRGCRESCRVWLWAVLLPLSFLWAFLTWARRRWYPKSRSYRSSLKVLCVGNLHSGGSAKTPLVLEICERFKGRNPSVVSRGYLGRLCDTGAKVDLGSIDGPALFGDEPWMLANRLGIPVYVGKNRRRSLRCIEQVSGKGFVVLDDGFQHLAVQRDLDLVAVSTRYSPDDSFCLPLGLLREPVGALGKAGCVVLVHANHTSGGAVWRDYLARVAPGVPVFDATKRLDGFWEEGRPVEEGSLGPVAAFCGVAHPEGFFGDLADRLKLVFSAAYPDHHRYSSGDATWISLQRKSHGARALVTTEKDWYKIYPLLKEQGERLVMMKIRYELPAVFWSFVESELGF